MCSAGLSRVFYFQSSTHVAYATQRNRPLLNLFDDPFVVLRSYRAGLYFWKTRSPSLMSFITPLEQMVSFYSKADRPPYLRSLTC